MTFCQLNNNNSTHNHYSVHHAQHHHHHNHNQQQVAVVNIKSTTNSHLSNTNVIKKLNGLVCTDDPLVMSNANPNTRKFSINSSSFNQSNRTKFAYRNYLSKPNTTNEFIFNDNKQTSFIIKEEGDPHDQNEVKQNTSIDIFSSLSSSSSTSSSTSSSVSPTFSSSNCFDNSNYADSKAIDKPPTTDRKNPNFFVNQYTTAKLGFEHDQTLKNIVTNDNSVDFSNDTAKFEDLQRAGMILRKALKEIRTPSSSDLASESKSGLSDLAFDNLTYFSSNEDLNETSTLVNTQQKHKESQQSANLAQINSDIIKKTLKSIKRKEKMKKNFLSNDQDQVENGAVAASASSISCLLASAKSMPDLSIGYFFFLLMLNILIISIIIR